jgi:hypothetical protein
MGERGALTVLDPTVGAQVREFKRGPRLATVKGATIGLLNNSKANVDIFMVELAGILKESFGVHEVLFAGKASSSRIASQAILDDLSARANGIITGIGD